MKTRPGAEGPTVVEALQTWLREQSRLAHEKANILPGDPLHAWDAGAAHMADATLTQLSTLIEGAAPPTEDAIRQWLWTDCRHDGKYGDDGEMQCRGVDFLRDPLLRVIAHVIRAAASEGAAPRAEGLDVERLDKAMKAAGLLTVFPWAEKVAAEYASLAPQERRD